MSDEDPIVGEPSCFDRCEGVVPTLCDGDTTNNYWFEGGVCQLDRITKSQFINSIQRSPQARRDLPKITSCFEMLQLLEEVPLLSTVQEDDAQQSEFNRGDCLPFNTIYRGNLVDR